MRDSACHRIPNLVGHQKASGSAKLELEGQKLLLKKGDSWLVPAKTAHRYKVTEHFKAIEATAPPAEFTVATRPER